MRQTSPRPVLDCGSCHDRNQPGGTLSEEQVRCGEGRQGRLVVGARPRAISIMPINVGPLPALDMVSGPVVIIVMTAVWARLSSPSSPPPLSVTLIFFVINQPPAGLVGLVQYVGNMPWQTGGSLGVLAFRSRI